MSQVFEEFNYYAAGFRNIKKERETTVAVPPLVEPFLTRIHPDRLTDFCMGTLEYVGMSDSDARITSEILVRTDMRGIYTHGTVSLRRYVQMMRDGGIDVHAVPEIISEGPAWALMDAHQAVGMVAGHAGMENAVLKARNTGLGMTTVRRSNHFGAASAYALMAADQGLAGIAMSNTDVVMNIPGGRGAAIGNNPLSYAIPAGKHPTLVLDIAMSTVSGGRVKDKKVRGKPIPPGWLTDRDGLPTTDPGVFNVDGALTPFSAHKGYGMALLVESLAGILAGAAITTDILSWASESSQACGGGHAFIAIDIAAMTPPGPHADRMDKLISQMKNVPKARDADRTFVPGEMEWECEQEALRHGVPLTQDAVDSLNGLARDIGFSFSVHL